MINSVVFDFDGVIHNTLELGYKIHKVIFPGNSIEDYANLFMGNIFKDDKLTPENMKKFYELQEKEFKLLKVEKKIRDELLILRNKYRLFIITSNRERDIETYFQNNDLVNIFEKVLGFETHKSKEEKFKMLFNKFGVKKEECVFVTDTLGDILEANKVGLITIAVDFGFHKREILERGNPYKIISDFSHIGKEINNIIFDNIYSTR